MIFIPFFRHELNNAGFPPEIVFDYYDDGTNSSYSDFVRIKTLNILGDVVLRTQSRPLGKILNHIVFSRGMIQELNDEIKRASDERRAKTRIEGITTDQLSSLYGKFFNDKAKAAVKATLEDIAQSQIDPSRETVTVAEAKKILSKARSSLLSYAEDVSKLSTEKIKSDLKKEIQQVVGSEENLDAIDRHVDEVISNTIGALTSTFGNQRMARLEKIRNMIKKEEETAAKSEDELEFGDDIPFADW